MTRTILKKRSQNKTRCHWASGDDTLMQVYHDTIWGVPKKKDRDIFEAIVLDTNQAGLSWRCILHKRDNFAKAFYSFEPTKIAKMTKRDVDALMKDAGIIRHRGKIEATIANAKAFLALQKEYGTAATYFWKFTGGKTIRHHYKSKSQIPATSKEGDAMSRDLKKRGFRFCGPVMCYAFMQGIGMVHDHTTDCFCYRK